MMIETARGAAAALIAVALVFAGAAPAQAQTPSVSKQCGEKWAAAKAAGTTGDLTWPKFLSQCRSEMAAAQKPATAPAVMAAATPPSASTAVFPTAVASKYASLSPGKARMQTCLDQYNANKATNANGGLKWIEKGGGYYSQCNTRLKG
jgi:hypothetical protein